jgi:hypothetical protein
MFEGASLFRQLVLDPDRRLGNDETIDDPFRLELPQALRQHAIADVGDRAAKLGEPHPSLKQQLDHGTRPSAADQFDGAVKPDAQTRLEAHTRILAETSHLTLSTYLIIVTKHSYFKED